LIVDVVVLVCDNDDEENDVIVALVGVAFVTTNFSASCISSKIIFIVSFARFSNEQNTTSIAGIIVESLDGSIPFVTANCIARPAAFA
jgi:hypothetical protein